MEVELPEAPSCQEESSMQKRKRDNGENINDSPKGTSLVVDRASLLVVDTRSDLVLETAQPCGEADQQVEATVPTEAPISDQSGESNCLPLKKRQRIEPNDVNNGISSMKKDEIMLDNGENTCGVLSEVVGLDNQGEVAREMVLCHANEARIAQLHCENSPSCKEDINGDTLCHSDMTNCSELENRDCKDMAVECDCEDEAILVHASLEIASAELPANSAGKEPLLTDGDFHEDLKLHNQEGGTQAIELCKSAVLETEENKDNVEVQVTERHKSHVEEASEAASNGNGGALPLPNTEELCKSAALETEENKDNIEVQLAEQHKSHVEEASEAASNGNGEAASNGNGEAASNGNGGALPLPNTDSFKENLDHHMKTDNKEATPSVSQDLSKDNFMEKDIVSKEDAPQSLLNNSLHVSATDVTKKKLLILDLNGLLADIIPYCNERYKHDFVVNRKYVYKRPHVDDFLQFCFERFAVAVWSSRTKRNIEPLLELLIGPSQGKLLFCWDQYHCTQTRFTTVDNSDKPLVFKELCKVWEKHYDNLSWEKGQYNETNTLLLDDSPYKALLNPANTAIFPNSYRYTRIHDNSLGHGGDLRVYLEGLAVADNVQEYVRDNPFGQKPITESSPSWHYYQRVMRSYSRQDYTRESRRDDSRKWSHRDDSSRKWSHRYDARKWSHRDDARKWSHRDDARESRHEDVGKLQKRDAKELHCDYAGKSPKDDARQSETHTDDVRESTSTAKCI